MKKLSAALPLVLLSACATEISAEFKTDMSVPAVVAAVETVQVASSDDAADDPALFYSSSDPSKSYVVGTDKRAGLYLYDLNGEEMGFLPVGSVNNVDLVEFAEIGKGGEGAFGFATNRSDNTVSAFKLKVDGAIFLGGFPTVRDVPYGTCSSAYDGKLYVMVTHKGGEVDLYKVTSLEKGKVKGKHLQTEQLGGQLEGCVFDEENNQVFIGEEEAGISRYDLGLDDIGNLTFTNGQRIEELGNGNGLEADIEGLTVYRKENGAGYLVASSQGNNTYAVYDRQSHEYLGRFRVGDNQELDIDGAEETDGIDVESRPLPGFPKGVLIVQDGFNKPSTENQNFKIIDWRQVEDALGLE